MKKQISVESIIQFKVKDINKKWSYVKVPEKYVGRKCYVEIDE